MPCYDVDIDTLRSPGRNSSAATGTFSVVMMGNPNVGKTSLFNALTGLNGRTANFPGTTVERKFGRLKTGARPVEIVDLPGIYSLQAATPEERVASAAILGKAPGLSRPDLVLVVADATNIERSLFLVSQILEHDLPVVIVLNMIDIAAARGITVDVAALEHEIGCPVIPTVARYGRGLDAVTTRLVEWSQSPAETMLALPPRNGGCTACGGCPFQSRYTWSENVAARCVQAPATAWGQKTEMIDRVLTHPVAGIGVFALVMLTVFYLIFSVANVPMDLIDTLFAHVGAWIATWIPAGKLQSLVVDGIIGGVGGMLVFLPQICILFLFLALLEDSGYLARAAFVMDRLMRKVGLPGTAFVPLLSAHACAIPAIMATRVIRDPRDRLVTILIAPLMTCSARIPVYAMLTALLFPHSPAKAALVFTAAYILGIVAAITMAFVLKRTLLPGDSKPLVLELPEYRVPCLKTALRYTWDRGAVFIRQAGTIILAISITLWALATFPETAPPAATTDLRVQAAAAEDRGDVETAEALRREAVNVSSRHALANSYAGRLGKFIEPVVEPLGFDWQIGIGIVSSLAAREVIVSTLAVVYGVGEDSLEHDQAGLYATLRQARRSDGSPVFTMATSLSLLVFYVLAMQCLPTQAVTKRETNSWKWAAFQFAYMTGLAYGASLITYRVVSKLMML